MEPWHKFSDVMTDKDYTYANAEAVIRSCPEKDEVTEKTQVLTWRNWTIALSGIKNFIGKFRGMDFEFEIYVDVDDDTDHYVGQGFLVRTRDEDSARNFYIDATSQAVKSSI